MLLLYEEIYADWRHGAERGVGIYMATVQPEEKMDMLSHAEGDDRPGQYIYLSFNDNRWIRVEVWVFSCGTTRVMKNYETRPSGGWDLRWVSLD